MAKRGCSHGKTFDEPCHECELILLREGIEHAQERIAKWHRRIAEIEALKTR